MNRRFTLLSLALMLSMLLINAGNSLEAQVNDQVYLLSNPGESVKGLIDAVSASDVTVRVNGVPRKLAANDVARIQFADSPTELLQAGAMFRRGQLNDARTELGNVNLAEVNNKWIHQDVAYMLAFIETRSALAGDGDKNNAGTLLVAFLNDNADSYHYYEAVELFGDLAYAVGEFATAATQYTILTNSPWPALQVRGTLRLANSTLGKGDFAGALALYEKVGGINATTPAMQLTVSEAKAGLARCLGETGKAAAGIALTNKLIKDNDPKTQKQLFAQTYNAQGVCYRGDNKPKDAILAFLHTHLIFNDSPDAHAESLYHLSQLWEEVNKADRAQETKRLLRDKYAGTFWEKKSRTE